MVSIQMPFDLPVHTHHHCVVPLVWLQSDLFLRLQLVGLQLLDLPSKHLGRLSGGINAISLRGGGGGRLFRMLLCMYFPQQSLSPSSQVSKAVWLEAGG